MELMLSIVARERTGRGSSAVLVIEVIIALDKSSIKASIVVLRAPISRILVNRRVLFQVTDTQRRTVV